MKICLAVWLPLPQLLREGRGQQPPQTDAKCLRTDGQCLRTDAQCLWTDAECLQTESMSTDRRSMTTDRLFCTLGSATHICVT